jgi:hypothetical protein
MYKTLLIIFIILLIFSLFYKSELFTNNNEIKKPNIDTIVINDVVLNKSNFINDKIIDNNNLLITPTKNNIAKVKQEEINQVDLSNIMVPFDKFDQYFNEYNILIKNNENLNLNLNLNLNVDDLNTNINSGLLNTDITNIYNKYIKRVPTYLNDPNMRSFNIDESRNYSGLMDIGLIKLI